MGFLMKGYTNNADVPVEYWKCISCNIDNFYKAVDMKFGGWVTKDARAADKDVVQTHMVRCLTDKFDEYFGVNTLSSGLNPIKQAYEYAYANDSFFKSAVDDNDVSK